jgi:hypothetical protein
MTSSLVRIAPATAHVCMCTSAAKASLITRLSAIDFKRMSFPFLVIRVCGVGKSTAGFAGELRTLLDPIAVIIALI